MRVLVVTSLYFPGRGNWVVDQVRSLQEIGLDVDVVFFNTEHSRWGYASSIPTVARALTSHRYDIIHTHHTYTMFNVLIARRLSGIRVPIVFTNHEGEVLDREARTLTWHPTNRLRNSLGLKRYAVRRADFVIFVSNLLARRLAFEGRYAIIPCGIDLDRFRPLNRSACRKRLAVDSDALVIFFPGDPSNYRKRFALAEAAFALVRKEAPDAVMLTGGGIQPDEMPLYYGASDVVVQTSFFEASPTVVKEALGCETPVVSIDVGDTRDLLEGISYCAVCSESPADLAAGLLAARGQIAVGARQRLLAKGLSLPQVASRIARVYEEAVG